jgi:hypothetical protein
LFGFVQWDNSLMLLMELALSIAVIAGIMFVARLTGIEAGPRSPESGPHTELPPEAAEESLSSADLAAGENGAGGTR